MKVLCVLSRFAYGRPERGENYDYVHFVSTFERMGYEVSVFDTGDRSLHHDFADLNKALLERVAALRPNVIFCVLMHYEVWSETLDLIRTNTPALIVNWGTDDSWKFTQASRFFAQHVDLHVTTDLAAERSAGSFGLKNVFLSQWAASDTSLEEPRPSMECRYDVSFVGSVYGGRSEWIAVLRRHRIEVSCFGHGTENGVIEASGIPEIYRNSRISLNFSGSGQHLAGLRNSAGRQIKARTFEVPGAGGFLLTETTPGLERYFSGDEIATFDSPEELVARTQYFLQHPEERDRIARAGHARIREQHTYEKRFAAILEKLLAVGATRRTLPWSLPPNALTPSVERYRGGGRGRWGRAALIGLSSILFGKKRGPRAARRFVYEWSWRFAGATTYSSSGLPGRLFYAES